MWVPAWFRGEQDVTAGGWGKGDEPRWRWSAGVRVEWGAMVRGGEGTGKEKGCWGGRGEGSPACQLVLMLSRRGECLQGPCGLIVRTRSPPGPGPAPAPPLPSRVPRASLSPSEKKPNKTRGRRVESASRVSCGSGEFIPRLGRHPHVPSLHRIPFWRRGERAILSASPSGTPALRALALCWGTQPLGK